MEFRGKNWELNVNLYFHSSFDELFEITFDRLNSDNAYHWNWNLQKTFRVEFVKSYSITKGTETDRIRKYRVYTISTMIANLFGSKTVYGRDSYFRYYETGAGMYFYRDDGPAEIDYNYSLNGNLFDKFKKNVVTKTWKNKADIPVEAWAKENGIDLDNLTEEDKILIKLRWF